MRPEIGERMTVIKSDGHDGDAGLDRGEPSHVLQVERVEEEETTERREGGHRERDRRRERDRAEEAKVDQRLLPARFVVQQGPSRAMAAATKAITIIGEVQPAFGASMIAYVTEARRTMTRS